MSASIAISCSDVLAQQRLAPGEADLLDAVALEDAREPRDFLERQQLVPRQEFVVGPEHLARHAVHAAEVAAIGDRDAQVVESPPARVEPGVQGRAGNPLDGQGLCAPPVADRNHAFGHAMRSRIMKCSS